MFRGNNKLGQIKHNQKDDADTVILSEKPLKIQRLVSITSMGGIPVIREIVIIETEASLSRVLGIILSMLIYAIIFQIMISLWQRYHLKSCKMFITTLLFTFPPLLSLYYQDYIFFGFCLLYNSLIAKTVIDCLKKPIRSDTPKRTYKIIKGLFRSTYFCSFVSNVILVIGFFVGIPIFIAFSLILMTGSLYFALLTRETIDFLSEKMATNIGFYSKDGVPTRKLENNICAVCGDKTLNENINSKQSENIILTLKCGHGFHEECIKGWLFMGKKGFCPCCMEKVDIEGIRIDFWEKGQNIFTDFIDLLRKMIVFVSMFLILTLVYKFKKKIVS